MLERAKSAGSTSYADQAAATQNHTQTGTKPPPAAAPHTTTAGHRSRWLEGGGRSTLSCWRWRPQHALCWRPPLANPAFIDMLGYSDLFRQRPPTRCAAAARGGAAAIAAAAAVAASHGTN